MNPEHYKLVFSEAECGYKAWWFPAFGLIFVFLGIFAVPILNQFSGRPRSPLFQLFFVGFAILWTVVSFATTLGDYLAARSALTGGTALYVEGTVEHFVPMPATGHAVESFDVKGVPFSYSDFILTAGFNNTSSHGGPIREGLPVHVWYRDVGSNGNEILKLEIAGD